MINLILEDKQAIMLYRVLVAAAEIRPEVSLIEIQAVLGHNLAPLEMEAYKKLNGFVVCKHCNHAFQDRYKLTEHVRVFLKLGLAEAVNVTKAWYLPDIILGEE